MKPDHQQSPPRPSGEAESTTNNDSDTENTDMSQTENGTAPAEQIDDFEHLKARQTGFNRWTVTNLNSGTAYQVRLGGENGIACDCPDHKYTPDRDEFEACKHVLYASFQAPATMDTDMWAMRHMGELASQLQAAVDRADHAAETMDTALVRTREVEAEAPVQSQSSETDDRPSLEETTPEPTHDPETNADKLRDAFNVVVEDMEVEVGDGGAIWVKTGYETPETIETPGPGGPINVWEVFIKEPEALEYVPDDHPASGDRPSQYFKNRIEPGAVDDYVSEVLE